MADPAIILLDEPAAGVNPTLLELIIDAHRSTLNAEGVTILLIEHNMDMVARLCRRVVVMAERTHPRRGPRPTRSPATPPWSSAYLGAAA